MAKFLDETGVGVLWDLVKERVDAAAKIEVGSYTGTGKYGSSNKNSLTFGFEPKMVMVYANTGFRLNSEGAPVASFLWGKGTASARIYSSNGTGNITFAQTSNSLA